MPRKLSPRKQPSQDRARATVEALLTAAAQVLETEGDAGFTTNKIAARAGVSIGTLYQYFPNKESLTLGLIQKQHDRIRAAVRGPLERHASAPLPVAVRAALTALLEVYRPNLRLSTSVEKVAATLGDRSEMEIVLEELQAWTCEFLQHHRGALGLSSPELMSLVLVRALEGVLMGVARAQPELLETDALLEQLERLVLGYLAPGLGAEVTATGERRPSNDVARAPLKQAR